MNDKKVDFKTCKGKFSFIKLNNGVTNLAKGLYPACLWYRDCFGYQITDYEIPLKEDDKIIGFVKDLTEEQWEEVVDSFADCGLPTYMDYETQEGCTAKESGKSLMNVLEVYIEDENNKSEERVGNWILIKYGV